MTEQEKSQEPQNPYYDREKAQAAVIATNAVITDEQFEKLKQSTGKQLVLVYEVKEQYSEDDSRDQTYTGRTPFTLTDFNFVTDPQTKNKYLAYLRSLEGNIFYPACEHISLFDDFRWVMVEKVIEADSGAVVWSFDKLGRYVQIDRREAGSYVKAINDLTLSYVNLTTNKNDSARKKPNYEEKESSNPEFDREFSVQMNLVEKWVSSGRSRSVGFVVYRFFYRVNGVQADVLGDLQADSMPINDDDERDRIAASFGEEALVMAKKHIKDVHPEVEEIIVQPEELRIGGVYGPEYVAWNKEGTTVERENE